MPTGTVQFFNQTKGFGFIKEAETKEPIYVHATGLINKIKDNDPVSYDVGQGEKRTRSC